MSRLWLGVGGSGCLGWWTQHWSTPMGVSFRPVTRDEVWSPRLHALMASSEVGVVMMSSSHSREHPERAMDGSLMVMDRVLQVLDELDTRGTVPLVYLSSVAVYPFSTSPRGADALLPNPSSFYGQTKLIGERLVRLTERPSVIFRVANGYGPRSKAHTILETMIHAARLTKRIELECDGSSTRDFVHVSDVGRAICGAMKELDERNFQAIHTLATGEATPLRQVAEWVAQRFEAEVVCHRRVAPTFTKAFPVQGLKSAGWLRELTRAESGIPTYLHGVRT